MFNSFFLALSTSIDAFGIGITYGIKNTRISFSGKLIIFILLFIVTYISLFFGSIIKNFLPPFLSKLFGSGILICMGLYILFQGLTNKKNSNTIFNNPNSADLDNSNIIDNKESISLAVALSLDVICVSIGLSFSKLNLEFFPFFISTFHLLFLFLGVILGKKINSHYNLPENIWSIISSILLLSIGLFRLI